MEEKGNPIVEFLNGGGDLLSEEGEKLILEVSNATITLAMEINSVAGKLVTAMSQSTVQLFKQKILDVCVTKNP